MRDLMTTKVDDMTVGDSLKVTALVLGATYGAMGAVLASGVVYDKFYTWNMRRKTEKLAKESEK